MTNYSRVVFNPTDSRPAAYTLACFTSEARSNYMLVILCIDRTAAKIRTTKGKKKSMT